MRHHFNCDHNPDNKFNALYIDIAQWSREADAQTGNQTDTQTDDRCVWLSRYLHTWATRECGVDPATLPTLPTLPTLSMSAYLQETVRATKQHTGKPIALFLDNIDYIHTDTGTQTTGTTEGEGEGEEEKGGIVVDTHEQIQNVQSAFLTEACTLHRHVGGTYNSLP